MSTTTPPLAWGYLQPGSDRTHQVRALQYLLRSRGQQVTVDGGYGPATVAAVKAIQQAAHLTVDGVCGPTTYPALVITIRPGSSGDAVGAAQEMFDSGNAGLAVDGSFGPVTEKLTRQMQSAFSLVTDGVIGPQSWARLTEYDAP